MSKRRDELKSLFGMNPEGQGETAPAVIETKMQPVERSAETPAARTPSGAVKAMGLALGGLQREIEEARKLAGPGGIVSLDPALIDPSPYADRLSDGHRNDERFADLVESLKTSGQQVPVLVRPHPDPARAGRYQAAYGHRRIKAAREAGLEVQAIVRSLDDAALLLAQGKENAERRDLSFIEKALFAAGMQKAGIARADAQAALGLHKTEMTRLLQLAEMIPEQVARAIGPAPKAGRPRWMALGELLKTEAARVKADDEIAREVFRQADSDTRFAMVFARLSRRKAASGAIREIKAGKTVLARLSRGKAVTRFDVPDSAGDGFADWLAEELPALAARFRAHGG